MVLAEHASKYHPPYPLPSEHQGVIFRLETRIAKRFLTKSHLGKLNARLIFLFDLGPAFVRPFHQNRWVAPKSYRPEGRRAVLGPRIRAEHSMENTRQFQ